MKLPVKMTINGQSYSHEVEPRLLLVHYIRETAGLTGTHVGCDTSQCGACTILMNGQAVKACTFFTVQADGANIMKFPHPASRFAVVGVAAAVTLDGKGACSKASIGITGAGTKAVRAKGVEAGCTGKKLDAAAIEAAAQKAAEGVDVQADLQGSVEYKSHLCRVFAKRALAEAVKRAGG